MIKNTSKERMDQFSDGVFSIAITLLAIDLSVPVLGDVLNKNIFLEIINYIPAIAPFVLSFFTIAIFWVNHQQLTKSIEVVGKRIIWSNIIFLFFLTLLPFATSVVTENQNHTTGIMIYSFILFLASLSFSLVVYFTHRKSDNKKIVIGRSIVGPVVYLSAMIVSAFYIEIAQFLLVVPPLFYFLPRSKDETRISVLNTQ